MVFLQNILLRISRNYISKNQKQFASDFVTSLKENDEFKNQIFSKLRPELVEISENYPSIVNNGFLHIEKAIELVHYLNLDPKNSIIDIGGAAGNVSILFSNAFKNSKIFTFEPIQNTFKRLNEKVKTYSNIAPINKGLGNSQSKLTINLANRITSSSLLPIEQEISNEYFADNLKNTGSEVVEISTLDIEIPKDTKINIIKIDVQGYELEVLKGGPETLKRTNIVLLEMQNHELYINAPKYYQLDEFLRSQNFELYNIIPSIRQNKKIYEWDGIYVNKNLVK